MTKVLVSHWPLTKTCQPLKNRTREAEDKVRVSVPLILPRGEARILTEDEAIVREVRLQRSAVRQHLAVDALGLETGVEADSGEADTPPGDETADGGHLRG